MKTIYDIQQRLKRFGILIYTGNRAADLELMELELRELQKLDLIEDSEFGLAIAVLRKEMKKESEKNERLKDYFL